MTHLQIPVTHLQYQNFLENVYEHLSSDKRCNFFFFGSHDLFFVFRLTTRENLCIVKTNFCSFSTSLSLISYHEIRDALLSFFKLRLRI